MYHHARLQLSSYRAPLGPRHSNVLSTGPHALPQPLPHGQQALGEFSVGLLLVWGGGDLGPQGDVLALSVSHPGAQEKVSLNFSFAFCLMSESHFL
jgi:hypothetical protein